MNLISRFFFSETRLKEKKYRRTDHADGKMVVEIMSKIRTTT